MASLHVPVMLNDNQPPNGAQADDELVVETAINGHADAVATFNVRHMRDAATRFGFLAQRPGVLVGRTRA